MYFLLFQLNTQYIDHISLQLQQNGKKLSLAHSRIPERRKNSEISTLAVVSSFSHKNAHTGGHKKKTFRPFIFLSSFLCSKSSLAVCPAILAHPLTMCVCDLGPKGKSEAKEINKSVHLCFAS